MKKNRTAFLFRIVLIAIALLYTAVVLKIVVIKYGISMFRSGNLIPFLDVIEFIRGNANLSVMLKNIGGNIAVFIPFGIIAPALKSKPWLYKYEPSAALRAEPRFFRVLLAGFCTSLAIEIFQFVTGMGIFDVNDMITNTIGVLIGACIYFGVSRRIDRRLCSQAGSVIVIVLLGVACASTMWYFGYASNLVSAPVIYKNTEVLGELDVSTDDVNFSPQELTGEKISGVTHDFDEKTDSTVTHDVSYNVDENTKFFESHVSYDMSPNGNVRATTISYSKLTLQEAAELINQSQRFADGADNGTDDGNVADESTQKQTVRWVSVWLNGNICTDVIIDVTEDW